MSKKSDQIEVAKAETPSVARDLAINANGGGHVAKIKRVRG